MCRSSGRSILLVAARHAALNRRGDGYRPDNYFQLITNLAGDFRVIAPAFPPVSPLRPVLRRVAAAVPHRGVAGHGVGSVKTGSVGPEPPSW